MSTTPLAPPRLAPMLLLACCAFITTGAYAASFYVPAARRLAPAALEVSLGAACAWPVFGLVLVALTGARPSVRHWADACGAARGCSGRVSLGKPDALPQ